MPIKLIRLMDAYAERVKEVESLRLQQVRDSELHMVAEIQKVLKKRADEEEAKVGGARK